MLVASRRYSPRGAVEEAWQGAEQCGLIEATVNGDGSSLALKPETLEGSTVM